jgi:hypothetical protein
MRSFAFLSIGLACAITTVAAVEPADKYLFLDSRNFDRVTNTRLALGKVEKDPNNPLFTEDQPWEVRYDNLYANVMVDDDGLFKCWYCPFIVCEATSTTSPEEQRHVPYRPGRREMGLCYAESRDGIEWTKPNLQAVEFNGSKNHNIVMRDVHGSGVFKDMRDDDPQRRYKVFAMHGVAFSPDSIRWSDFVDCPEIEAAGDTHNNAFWNSSLKRYVGITRLWGDGQRIVGRTESTDFVKWNKAVEVLRGNPAHQTYAMPVFPYANVYLGLVMVLHTETDTVDCELAWSPDSEHWERICPGQALIPLGPDGEFDDGCVYAAAYPIVLDDEIRLYYSGGDDVHMSWRRTGLGLARLRLDGFAGLRPESSDSPAKVVTKSVLCTGSRLRVTADAAGGKVRVAVEGQDALTLESCKPITGNVTGEPVTWSGGDLSALNGKRVRLTFAFDSATLYSFQFADE